MRYDNRQTDELRNIEIIPNINLYAEGSCLIKCGNTHVLCTASVDDKIPQWLKGSDKGWITAEYSLLPRSTQTRALRETHGVGGRTHEIQRLIGRALRSVVDLHTLQGYLVTIDCDVLQADGGTRTASITGGFVALSLALQKMLNTGMISHNPIKEALAAVSVGICNSTPLLDLDYKEDSTAQVDANFVLTESGKIIELQATAEQEAFTVEEYQTLLFLAQKGINQLILKQKEALNNVNM